ncbi:MAG TPA: extracellular solute-binding protein [Chloroflexota bacterium]|nr:extracellular solute-binding protein [Chloroflexota bacterium]
MTALRRSRRALLGTALTPALLAACGSDEDLEALPKSGESQGKLVYATWGTQQRQEIEHWSLLAFEKNYPDLRVDIIASETPDDHVRKVISMLSTGAPADVFRLPSWSAPTFYNEEAVTRLDPYMKRDGFKPEHLAQPFDVAMFKRRWYALPRGQHGTYVMFYNRTLFQRAGVKPPAATWTWEDFLSSSRELTRPNAPTAQWGTQLESLADFYYPWLWGNGGDDLERTGEKATLNQEPARDALRWLADLRLKHRVTPDWKELPQGPSAFASGRVALWFGPADAELTLKKMSDVDFGIAPQPKGKQGQQAAYMPDVVAMASGSQAPNDAWELLQYLVDVDTQRLEYENGLWLPQSKALVGEEAYLKPTGAPHDRRPGIPGAGLRPRTPTLVPRADDIRRAMQKDLEPFWRGAKGVVEATDAATQSANAILNGEA